jgi:hypothetical protein
MPGKWQIINGVKYPVEDFASSPPEDEVYLPRSYWKAKKEATAIAAATIIQKYCRTMIALNTVADLDPYLTFQTTCHWCGECSDDVSFVKSYQLFGCRGCASECGDDY